MFGLDAEVNRSSLPSNAIEPITNVMAESIQNSEIGPDVAYYLGTNIKEAERIARLSPILQAKEIGKMLGLYEPEVIKLETMRSAGTVQRKLMTMSDEELMEIAEGTAKVVDGEFQRLS